MPATTLDSAAAAGSDAGSDAGVRVLSEQAANRGTPTRAEVTRRRRLRRDCIVIISISDTTIRQHAVVAIVVAGLICHD
jgi:hypothetical protein